MPDIIDVSASCGSHAGFFAGAGVKTVIRYYSRDTGRPSKRLSRQEARRFTSAGLRVGAVHEARRGDLIESFTKELGNLDGAHAQGYGASEIGQPAGSAIYFAVDLDASAAQIRDAVLPYFQGIADAFGAAVEGQPRYKVGVYGSGAACAAVLDAGLAELAWLAQSRGWAGFKAFQDSKRWSMRQLMQIRIDEVDCDPDEANPERSEIGDFFLETPSEHETIISGAPLAVIARDGLRLRSGPGTEFNVLRLIPNGTKVHPIKAVGDWTMVDLVGDLAADGFVNTHFLGPIA